MQQHLRGWLDGTLSRRIKSQPARYDCIASFYARIPTTNQHIVTIFTASDVQIVERFLFIRPELPDAGVHCCRIEDTLVDQYLKIGKRQSCHMRKEVGLQVFYHIHERLFPIVAQVHEDGYSRRELLELLLYLASPFPKLLLLFGKRALCRLVTLLGLSLEGTNFVRLVDIRGHLHCRR